MMKHTFRPKGVCSRQIDFTLTEDNRIESLHFTSGCPGNLEGISRLVQGMEAERVIALLKGTLCGRRSTSCPDQLCRALEEALEARKKSA